MWSGFRGAQEILGIGVERQGTHPSLSTKWSQD